MEYSLLLPRGRHSSHSDIAELLATLAVGEDGFQIGRTKVGRLLLDVILIAIGEYTVE